MTTSGFVIVTTTHDDEAQAYALADGIVKKHLAACVQVVEINSVYRWEGEVQHSKEWRLECKTRAGRVPALEEYVKTHHSYDLPEFVVTPMETSVEYGQWIEAETQAPTMGI